MNTKYVTVGKPKIGGAVWRAPLGTELPKNATDKLDAAFKDLGYCSDEGVSNNNSPESDKINAWGGAVVLTYQSGKSDTFGFTLIEALNEEVLRTVYGDEHVTGDLDSGLTVEANTEEQEPFSWVFEIILRGNTLKRIVIPEASITEIGELKYVDGEPLGYALTIEAVPDKNNNTHYEYFKKASINNAEG